METPTFRLKEYLERVSRLVNRIEGAQQPVAQIELDLLLEELRGMYGEALKLEAEVPIVEPTVVAEEQPLPEAPIQQEEPAANPLRAAEFFANRDQLHFADEVEPNDPAAGQDNCIDDHLESSYDDLFAEQPQPEAIPEIEPTPEELSQPAPEPEPAPEPRQEPTPETAPEPAKEEQPKTLWDQLQGQQKGTSWAEKVQPETSLSDRLQQAAAMPRPTPEPAPEPLPAIQPEPNPNPTQTQESAAPSQPAAPSPKAGSQPSLMDLLRQSNATTEQPAASAGRTLGETMGAATLLAGQLDHQTNHHKVADLRTVININDKFLFMGDLFHNNMKAYNDFILHLNAIDDRDEALAYVDEVAAQYMWDRDSLSVKTFYSILERKF